MTGRPNFYNLLELSCNPPELDKDKIKFAIETKKKYWNSRANMPGKRGEEAKYFSSLTGEMISRLVDDEFWEEEAERAHTEELEKKRELERIQNEQLDRMIEIASSKGFITKLEISFIKAKLSVPEAAIQKRINVEVKEGKKKTKQSSSDGLEMTNPSTLKEIASLLSGLNVKPLAGSLPTLYDFLGIPEKGSARSVLFAEANEQFALYQRKAKGSQDTESRRQLYSIAKQIFHNETERKKYDNSLAGMRLEQANNLLEIACAGGVVDFFTYEALMKRLQQEGVPQKLAKDHIRLYCAQKGAELRSVKGDAETEVQLLQCGICGVIHDDKSRHCTNCGDALNAPCKKCGTMNKNNSNHCSSCSFPISGQFTHQKLLNEGFFLLSCNRLDEAKAYFERARKIWDNNETAAGLQQIASHKKRVSDQVQKIESEMKFKRFYRAEQEWIRLKKLDAALPEHGYFEREIALKIRLADSLVQKAMLASNQAEAEKLCIEAISVCADNKDAEEKLSHIPPEPPLNGMIQPSGKTITISWKPSVSKGSIVYQLLRKEAGSHEEKLLAETADFSYRDSSVEAGKSYSYTILSKRGKVSSAPHKASGQGFFTAEAENLQAHAASDSITITWKAPPRSKIEVWKKENQQPSRRGDGVRLSGVKGNELIDTDVEKGKRYGYLVMVQYQDESGRIIFSNGKPVMAVAMNTEPIKDLSIGISGDTIKYQCTKPAEGEVYFLISESPFDEVQVGEISLFQDLSPRYGGRLLRVPHACEGVLDLPKSGRCSVLPVTKVGEMAIAGTPKAVKQMFEVTDLDAVMNDQGKLLLTWNWPETVEHAVVAYSYHSFPQEPKDPAAVHREVSLTAYNAFGGYLIDQPGSGNLFIKVFIMEELNGEITYSEGESYYYTNSQPIRLSYKVEMKFFKKKKFIRISSENPAVPLPRMVIIKQSGRQPISITDGREIAAIEDGRMPADALTDISSHSEQGCYVKVFLSNPKDYKRFTLEPFGDLLIH
ncbi:hypothetical protein J9317_18255 [Metabacillus sp. KIGAM252]|uniref:Fibronectin type-III domain-containing protein n=1 Tax=Metabacillus flavus TaxID=2823519 RepID=A0ABS5LIV4_9BACI|nr:fibronectin type III domain-containing protein [Metabacillus flavus]MBS2970689.1 hypothetical protein [Metabacillus flavus]